MAASFWDPSIRSSIARRAERVSADATPGWGRMNAGAMMAHINDSLRMALGDLPVKSKNLPLRYRPIRKFVIYFLPVPKGLPTAPELMARCQNAVLEDEKKMFAALVERCATVTPSTRLGEHPAFGDLSYHEYGALIAKHTDHHLRQFGV